ncbi:MAG TPA: STAS domain-containing protein, partial [Planctomycetota bacterium]|nr:STAS domain-containing protein [Planctomycetota bacterium]
MGNLDFQLSIIQLEDTSRVAILDLKGSIDGSTVKKFEAKTLGLYNEGVKYLILNFSEIGYMNSTGLGILVKVLDQYQETDGDLKLVKVPQKVADLFDMLGISSILTCYETMDEAIASLPSPVAYTESNDSSQKLQQKSSLDNNIGNDLSDLGDPYNMDLGFDKDVSPFGSQDATGIDLSFDNDAVDFNTDLTDFGTTDQTPENGGIDLMDFGSDLSGLGTDQTPEGDGIDLMDFGSDLSGLGTDQTPEGDGIDLMDFGSDLS